MREGREGERERGGRNGREEWMEAGKEGRKGEGSKREVASPYMCFLRPSSPSSAANGAGQQCYREVGEINTSINITAHKILPKGMRLASLRLIRGYVVPLGPVVRGYYRKACE